MWLLQWLWYSWTCGRSTGALEPQWRPSVRILPTQPLPSPSEPIHTLWQGNPINCLLKIYTTLQIMQEFKYYELSYKTAHWDHFWLAGASSPSEGSLPAPYPPTDPSRAEGYPRPDEEGDAHSQNSQVTFQGFNAACGSNHSIHRIIHLSTNTRDSILNQFILSFLQGGHVVYFHAVSSPVCHLWKILEQSISAESSCQRWIYEVYDQTNLHHIPSLHTLFEL